MIDIVKAARPSATRDTLVLVDRTAQLKELGLETKEQARMAALLEKEGTCATGRHKGRWLLVHRVAEGARGRQLEQARRAGDRMAAQLNEARVEEAQLIDLHGDAGTALAMVEGLWLGNYVFRRYKTDPKGAPTLAKLHVTGKAASAAQLAELADVCTATCMARDLVNEPVSFLNAVQLAAEFRTMGRNAGFKVQVLNKAQIEAMGMGGLVAVNKGSPDPPTFTVMEWAPRDAVNKAPIVLVGKGVVYDTGGLSLKPTPNSMDQMKCDMAGAAAVAGALFAIARQALPVRVVALVPSTDNRPGGNAYVPGDVLRMHSGLTVEVLNTDAEGRLVLADAISYAERYKAELLVTVATLTGAAMRAIGRYGSAVMGTAGDPVFQRLEEAGEQVHERVARLPFWEEYDKEIDSEVADIKNLGSDLGGAQTAGKFLARFTTRPFVHIDIAGPAFLTRRDAYRTCGGTGVGVRLLYELIKRRAQD
ncbi:MAG: leucyl aminopeptidase [Flavobacteriales bacterium]|jgi:leucyl aminopeptidase|nr:leucyl aminopeptidase [Flavobacteriales bacterium]